MNELGAGLDGGRPIGKEVGVDAPTDAWARLQHDHAKAGTGQPPRGLEPRDAGADDDQVGVAARFPERAAMGG